MCRGSSVQTGLSVGLVLGLGPEAAKRQDDARMYEPESLILAQSERWRHA